MKQFILLLSLLAAPVAPGAEDEFLLLPEKIGHLKFSERTDYEDERLGYSLRYAGEGLLKADVYIYDKGIDDLRDGIDSKQAADEMADVLAGIKHFERDGKYADVKEGAATKKELKGLKIKFLWMRVGLKHVEEEVKFKGARISDSYLLIHRGCFVKVRVTMKKADLEKDQKDIDLLLREIATQVEKDEKKGKPKKERKSKSLSPPI